MTGVELYTGLRVTGVIPAVPLTQVNLGSGVVNFPAVDCPGWYDPDAGDIVDMLLIGSYCLIVKCVNRPGLSTLNVPSFTVTNDPTVPSDATSVTGTWLRPANTTPLTEIGFVRSAPVPPPPGGTLFVAASSSDTFDPTNQWDSRNGDVRQGSYPGIGAAFGCWFYPTLAAAAAGLTVTGMSLTVVRDRGGTGGVVNLGVFLHQLTARPNTNTAPTVVDGPRDQGANATIGAPCTFPVPAEWWAPLLAGGFGLGVTGGGYAVCHGPDTSPTDSAGRPLSGLLALTHT